MTTFDATYYDGVWGTVHRHDYCPRLAEALVHRHGLCRILDVGTGCGELVRQLRALGCDAWGVDVSEYAIANSCDREHVRLGSVLDLPFGAGLFDVVHSQGMFEYVAEPDVPAAIRECRRVGKLQDHAVDTEADFGHRDGFATIKSADWWEQQINPKILVSCPTYDGKEYSIERWVAAVNALDWPSKEILLVDNSETPGFFERWCHRVPMLRFTIHGTPEHKIAASMERIRKYFLAGNFRWWFNVEADVIVPPDMIRLLLGWGEQFDWLSHNYPNRCDQSKPMSGFGCSLFSRNIMQESFDGCPEGQYPDGWWWNSKIIPARRYSVIEAWWASPIEHLAS